MNGTGKGEASDLLALGKLAQQWENEVQKDIDILAAILDKVDRGEAIPKAERRRARTALTRLRR